MNSYNKNYTLHFFFKKMLDHKMKTNQFPLLPWLAWGAVTSEDPLVGVEA